MNLTDLEKEYLKKLIGAALQKGINSNAPDHDGLAIKSRDEAEILMRIYGKLDENDEEDN